MRKTLYRSPYDQIFGSLTGRIKYYRGHKLRQTYVHVNGRQIN